MANPALTVGDFEYLTKQISIFPGAWGLVVPNNPRRIYLSIGNASLGGWIWPNTKLSVGSGYPISATFPYQEFWFAKHGALVTSEWYCSTNGGGTVNVLEVIYSPRLEL